jgi:hypothetical protein
VRRLLQRGCCVVVGGVPRHCVLSLLASGGFVVGVRGDCTGNALCLLFRGFRVMGFHPGD